jgi:hypothetical protein
MQSAVVKGSITTFRLVVPDGKHLAAGVTTWDDTQQRFVTADARIFKP